MSLAVLILLAVSLAANAVLGWLVVRASKRLLQFDDLFEYFVDDIETNVKYFEKLSTTPVLSNAPEIMEANHNMNIMAQRLDEYLRRMEGLTHRTLRRNLEDRPPVKVGE
jgi:hypothetical protein